MEHTPGPWKEWSENYAHGSKVVDVGGETGGPIALVFGEKGCPNSRLVAAAPELLEAAINLVNLVNELTFNGAISEKQAEEWCKESRAAIAKASVTK